MGLERPVPESKGQKLHGQQLKRASAAEGGCEPFLEYRQGEEKVGRVTGRKSKDNRRFLR